MSKQRASSQRRDDIDANELIRHHLEEAATHLGMVRQLIQKVESNATSEGINIQLAKVGRYLKRLYTKYGGHPDA